MNASRRVVSIVTGTRAEFGLLRPVIDAVSADPRLDAEVIVTGTHLLPPAATAREVEAAYAVADRIEMQRPDAEGRDADAAALGRGVSGFAARFARHRPDVVVVLGDRIEAFAAAAAAAVAGIRVAHLHGGDRAEGIADEALRHAISKLAHIHLPATAGSVERLLCMGEDPGRIHLVGSPAVDGLDAIPPLDDDAWSDLGRPEIVFLLHPEGRPDEEEWADARRLLALCRRAAPTLALHPNHDPGRAGIIEAIEAAGPPVRPHLPRRDFIGLLRRARALVGNSSAGLIECAAVGVRAINVGPRQAGRERGPNVVDVPDRDLGVVDTVLAERLDEPLEPVRHPYGDGRTGPRVAEVLATFDPALHPITKHCTY